MSDDEFDELSENLEEKSAYIAEIISLVVTIIAAIAITLLGIDLGVDRELCKIVGISMIVLEGVFHILKMIYIANHPECLEDEATEDSDDTEDESISNEDNKQSEDTDE